MYRVVLKAAAACAVSALLLSPFVSSAKAVEVYLFKGAGDFSFINENMHFSRGLEKIAKQMNEEGIRAEVRRFGAVEDALATIRRRKPESVAFIGHSMGALASMAMARRMREEGIRVAYMGLIDIPGPVGVAGDNVEWVENYYSINPVYGRLTNVATHPKAKNIHVGGYIHNRMDDAPRVQNGLLAAVREVHAAEQGGRTIAPGQTPAQQLPLIEPPVDPWAGHRVATINVPQQPLNYQPPRPVAVATSPTSTYASEVDPVTTAGIRPVPKVDVGTFGAVNPGIGAPGLQPVDKARKERVSSR